MAATMEKIKNPPSGVSYDCTGQGDFLSTLTKTSLDQEKIDLLFEEISHPSQAFKHCFGQIFKQQLHHYISALMVTRGHPERRYGVPETSASFLSEIRDIDPWFFDFDVCAVLDKLGVKYPSTEQRPVNEDPRNVHFMYHMDYLNKVLDKKRIVDLAHEWGGPVSNLFDYWVTAEKVRGSVSQKMRKSLNKNVVSTIPESLEHTGNVKMPIGLYVPKSGLCSGMFFQNHAGTHNVPAYAKPRRTPSIMCYSIGLLQLGLASSTANRIYCQNLLALNPGL